MNRGGKGVQRAGVIEGEGAVVQRAGTSLLTSPPPHTHTQTPRCLTSPLPSLDARSTFRAALLLLTAPSLLLICGGRGD